MIDFDLERVFANDPSYPWLQVTNAISAVDEYLTLLDEHLPYISDQTNVRFLARFEKMAGTMHRDDLELEIHRVKTLTEEIVPLFFYGSFIISLWAAFEVAVNELAGYARKKAGARLQLNDLREQNTR